MTRKLLTCIQHGTGILSIVPVRQMTELRAVTPKLHKIEGDMSTYSKGNMNLMHILRKCYYAVESTGKVGKEVNTISIGQAHA